MRTICQEIINNYGCVTYRGFNDVLADEPVFALAMAIMDMKPLERKPEYYVFVPFATSFKSNYMKRTVQFTNPKDGAVDGCYIVHWGNRNTLRAQYRFDAHIVDYTHRYAERHRLYQCVFFRKEWLLTIYRIQDKLTDIGKKCVRLINRVRAKLLRK